MELSNILTPDRIRPRLDATTKRGVIEELIDLLAERGDLSDRDDALRAVLRREQTRSTGIGAAVAVPHGKSHAVDSLVMAVGRPAAPLEFNSVDARPVDLVILLLSPPDKTGPHIQALARISRIMSLQHLRRQLRSAETAEEIYHALTTVEAPAN